MVESSAKEKVRSGFPTLILILLVVQIALLFVLVQRILTLESTVAGSSSRTAPPSVTVDRIPDERGQVLGSQSATLTVVEFSDFQCPFCAEAMEPVKHLVEL